MAAIQKKRILVYGRSVGKTSVINTLRESKQGELYIFSEALPEPPAPENIMLIALDNKTRCITDVKYDLVLYVTRWDISFSIPTYDGNEFNKDTFKDDYDNLVDQIGVDVPKILVVTDTDTVCTVPASDKNAPFVNTVHVYLSHIRNTPEIIRKVNVSRELLHKAIADALLA